MQNTRPASGAKSSQPSQPIPPAEPSSSWASSMAHAMTRSYRSFIQSLASSSTTTTRGPALGERSPQRGPAAPGESKTSRDVKASKAANQDLPPTLDTLWPGHPFARGPVRSLCEALLAQKGQWKKMEIYKALLKLDGPQLAQVGEFAAYLQAHPSLRGAPVLSQLLVEVATPPGWPICNFPDEPQGLNLAAHLITGMARGLMRTDQTYSLARALAGICDGSAPVRLEAVPAIVVDLQGHVSDTGLRDVLAAVHTLKLPDAHGLLRQCRRLAKSQDVPVTALHRVVRQATCQPQRHSIGYGDWYRDWFQIMEAPPEGEPEIPPVRQFAIGHGVAVGCRHHSASYLVLRPALEGKHPATGPLPALPPPKLMPAARAGVLWALDPLAALAALPQDPDGALHLEACMALGEPLRQIGPVRLYETIEALRIPMAQRYRLQRMHLGQDGVFAAVRAAMLARPPAPSALPPAQGLDDGSPGAGSADDASAAILTRLADLYRYFGERDDLAFAFGDAPDLARIRAEEGGVRERMAAIEAAMRELEALAPAARPHETPAAAFLREGCAQVAKVTLGASLQGLQANLERAGRESGVSPQSGRDRKATPDGEGEADGAKVPDDRPAPLRALLAQLRDAKTGSRALVGDLVAMAERITSDKALEDALYVVRNLPLGSRTLADACLTQARSPLTAMTALHRLVRVGTMALLQPGKPEFDFWLRLMRAPAAMAGQAPPPLERQFSIGHGLGSGCARMERHNAQGQERIEQAWERFAALKPDDCPAARAGFLMAVDTPQALSALSRAPDFARYLDAWEALAPQWRVADAAPLRQTVETLDVSPALRERILAIALPTGKAGATPRDTKDA